MYVVAMVLAGLLVSLPLSAIAWLTGVAARAGRPSVDGRRVRRGTAHVLALILIAGFVAISLDGTLTPVILGACALAGVLLGCAGIDWFASKDRLTQDPAPILVTGRIER